jgi:hypothetical protein
MWPRPPRLGIAQLPLMKLLLSVVFGFGLLHVGQGAELAAPTLPARDWTKITPIELPTDGRTNPDDRAERKPSNAKPTHAELLRMLAGSETTDFKMRVISPDPKIDARMPIGRPDDRVDYKMIVVDPDRAR